MGSTKDALNTMPDSDRKQSESQGIKGMETISSEELSLTLESETDAASQDVDESLQLEDEAPEWSNEFANSPSNNEPSSSSPQSAGAMPFNVRYGTLYQRFRSIPLLGGGVLILLLFTAGVYYLTDSRPKGTMLSQPLSIPARGASPGLATVPAPDSNKQLAMQDSQIHAAIQPHDTASTRPKNKIEEKSTSSDEQAEPKFTPPSTSTDVSMPSHHSVVSTDPKKENGNTEQPPLLQPDLKISKNSTDPLPALGTSTKQLQQFASTNTSEKTILPTTSPKMVKFSTSQRSNHIYQQLKAAYRGYLKGDYDRARKVYSAVLIQKPKNRDALLGLAAVATKQGHLPEARRLYRQLLEHNPKDENAQMSLMGLQRAQDPVAQISRIKELLRRRPDSPQLHFNMGISNSALSRWGDAQRAFFQAFRLDNSNPNYAYNLAVSLDRLGKTEAAINYYQRALQLADNYPINFTLSTVEWRLQQLRNSYK